MLGVGLREHHQLDVGGVASERLEIFDEVVHFVGGEREAKGRIGLADGFAPSGQHGHGGKGLGRTAFEEGLARFDRRQDRFGHPVVQQGRDGLPNRFRSCTPRVFIQIPEQRSGQ